MANQLKPNPNMKDKETNQKLSQEISAIGTVSKVLSNIDPQAQKRVLDYVAKMFNIGIEVAKSSSKTDFEETTETNDTDKTALPVHEETQSLTDDGIEGISPVAQKWMRRNGLQANQLSSIFSLGVDEIDLVAKTIPDKGKRKRMYNVFLLKGVASYLSGGVARFNYAQAKETCQHYDAYDGANFATYLKEFAADISGGKETGYNLTARGLTNATELVKQMTSGKKAD